MIAARICHGTSYWIPAAWKIGSRNGGIRKESMKKFGTPIGAAPGSANEKVGLAGVGSPALVVSGATGGGLGVVAGAVVEVFGGATWLGAGDWN